MLQTLKELRIAEKKIKEAAKIVASTSKSVADYLTIIEAKARQNSDAFTEDELADARAARDLVEGYCAEIEDRAKGVDELCVNLARKNALERFVRFKVDEKDSERLSKDAEKYIAFSENVDTLVELIRQFENRFENEAQS